MRIAATVGEILIAAYLFLDGINRFINPVPAAPASVPWLAGFVWLAQWTMYAVGGMEVILCLGILLWTLEDLSEHTLMMHTPHHGARP